MRFTVDNPRQETALRHLNITPTWTDRLDVYVVRPDREAVHWRAGDSIVGAPYLDDALGYVFTHPFEPGRSEVYIRAATTDPLVLDVRLMTSKTAANLARFEHYAYGFLYGFLASLAIYNLVLYLRLGRRNSLYYSLYLFCFIVLNLCYTGRGFAWFWPEYPRMQRYILLVMMIMMAHSGLCFAREFLELKSRLRHIDNTIGLISATVLAAMLGIMVIDIPVAAAWLAFAALGGFVFTLVPLGAFAWYRGHSAAGYFLLAAVLSMLGIGMTLFSVWGIIPYNTLTYRSIEVGMMLEATLLALALTEFVRAQLIARQRAEREAQVDTLTQVFNRRGFFGVATRVFRTACRHQRPLSVIILDIDHFKSINDHYGHHTGDLVLASLAGLLPKVLRCEDIVARWGGEEFVVLLPETSLAAAAELAERIRLAIENCVMAGAACIKVTISLGVAQLAAETDLEELIAVADRALYRAKENGRNRVMYGE